MFKSVSKQSCFGRPFSAVAAATILTLGLGGCQTTTPSDITGSLGDTADKSQIATSRNDLDRYRERFRANPGDADAAMQYGKALRATGQRSQAVAVLEQASIVHPGNKALLAGYGRALADNGNFQQAFDVLTQAHSPDDPDWRILSAQGAALDQLGRYDEARQYYASALRIAPDEPTVLSNLGLSYVLAKDLPKAEEILRRAYGHTDPDPRVRANLAVVIGLQGRMTEAETLMKADLPAEQANANVAELKRLLSRTARAQRGVEKLPVASRATQD